MVGNTKLDRAEMSLRRWEKRLAEARNDRDQAKEDQDTLKKQFLEEKDPNKAKVLEGLLDAATKRVADTEQHVNEKIARVNKADDIVSELLIASNGNDNGTTLSFVGPLSCSPRCRCCLSSSSSFFFVLELQFLFFSVFFNFKKARRKGAI